MPTATEIRYLVIAGGGMPYVVCPAAAVRAGDDTVLALTLDLEALSGWDALTIDREAAAPSLEICQGESYELEGLIADDLWLLAYFEYLRPAIAGVLDGSAPDVVTAAEGRVFADLWNASLTKADRSDVAMRCMGRGAVDLGERPFGDDVEAPLHKAARAGMADVIAGLASAGHDVNRVDAGRNTPLHHAATAGQPAAAEALLRLGADHAVRNGKGWTPLEAARRSCCPDAFRPAVESLLWPLE